MTQKTNQNPWLLDVRVRERNLKSGAITDKDVEKHLAALPDVAEQAESFATHQPALAEPEDDEDDVSDDESSPEVDDAAQTDGT